ncbi:MAG TPA: anti-sigma factor [Alphaproteobacteria bacterium]|nr:anti-sigma factor [Alphaproteobacteria bacterium]
MTDQSQDREELQALAGEYVLGLLEDTAAREIERRMAEDAPLRAAVVAWRERFVELDQSAQPVSPSIDLWDRIARDVAGPAASPSKPRQKLWSNLAFWRSAAFAGAAASLVLAAVSIMALQQAPPRPVAVAVLQGDDAVPGAIIEAFADGSVRLVPLRAIDVPPGRALQVWTLWDRARGPVPLGVLARAEQRRLAQDNGLPRPIDQQLYEITLEPANGSPTGRPTGPILYKGLASTAIH